MFEAPAILQRSSTTKEETLTERIRERLVALNGGDPVRFSRGVWIAFGFLLLLLFLPLLGFPNGADNALFYVGGQKIFHQGAIHYRDIVDVKPPLIYYINALAITLFGDHPVSMRILDLIVQLLTCGLIIALIRRTTGRDVHAMVAAVFYALLYLGLNYANTSQVESFTGILLLPGIWLFLYRRKMSGFVLIGLLCGLTFFLKFTLGMALAAFLFGDLILYNDSWKTRLRNYTGLAVGFGVVVALFFLYLTVFDAWHGFLNMQEFLGGYTGMQWASPWSALRQTLQSMPARLGDEYSLAMLLGTIWCIIGITNRDLQPVLIPPGSRAVKTEEKEVGLNFLRFCLILILCMIISIAVEGKWFSYHLLRFFPFGAILASFGLISGLPVLLRGRTDRFTRFALATTAVFLIALGPFSRYVFHYGATVIMLVSGPESFDAYYAPSEPNEEWSMTEIRRVGNYVKEHRKEDEKLFVSSGVGAMVYLASDYVPEFYIFHAGFIIAPFAPDEWRDSTRTYLLEQRPKFIAVQSVDLISIVTGNDRTSMDVFREMPDLWNMLEKEYRVVMTTHSFVLYEKKD